MEITGTQTSTDAPNGATPVSPVSPVSPAAASGEAERLSAWAQGWAKSMARWRTVRHRWGAKGKKTLVRVASNPPLECMREILDYLSSAAGAKGLFCDGKAIGDWAPMSAWYEETRAEDGTQAVTVRVFQALRDPEDGEADGPFLVQDGCVWKVSHTFYWDVAEVEAVPTSASGVAYEIQGLRRDEETGLYSYALVKRERVAVEVGPWEAHQDGYQTRERALLLGLRDEDESTVDQKVEAFAQKAEMKLTDGDGVTVDIQKQKNDDCTTDVTIENATEQAVAGASVAVAEDAFGTRTTTVDRGQTVAAESSAALGGETRAEKTPGGRFTNTTQTYVPKTVEGAVTEETATLYESESTVTDRNTDASADAPDGAAPESPVSPESPETSPGTITRVREQLTPEGKIDRVTVTRKELPVSDAEKVTAQGALSKTVRVTHRNQAEAKVPKLVGTGDPAQGTVRRATVAKTPGDLRDVTVETTTSTAVAEGRAGGSCDTTLFEHRHAKVARNQKTAPAEATTAGGGKTYRVSSRLNEDGTFDTESTVTEELTVEDAQRSYVETAFQKEEVTQDRNAASRQRRHPGGQREDPRRTLRRERDEDDAEGGLRHHHPRQEGRPPDQEALVPQPDAHLAAGATDDLSRGQRPAERLRPLRRHPHRHGGRQRLLLRRRHRQHPHLRSLPPGDRHRRRRRPRGRRHPSCPPHPHHRRRRPLKCAASKGPSSVQYLGGRTIEQGGRGYYSYRYVQSVTTKTEDIPLTSTDSGHTY